MEIDMSFYLVAAAAVAMTGVSKSGFGGGLGVLAVPLMSLFISPQLAVAIMMPILLAMDLMIIHQYRGQWNRRIVGSLLPGAFAGLALGAALFQWMNAEVIRFLIGLLALVFVALFILGRNRSETEREASSLVGSVLGTVSGFASFVAHAGGPPVKGYLLSRLPEKTEFVATNTVFFFTLNAIKTIAYGGSGVMSVQSLNISLLLAPLLILGILTGKKLHGLVDQKVFVPIVYGFLAMTGAKLLTDSVPQLLQWTL